MKAALKEKPIWQLKEEPVYNEQFAKVMAA